MGHNIAPITAPPAQPSATSLTPICRTSPTQARVVAPISTDSALTPGLPSSAGMKWARRSAREWRQVRLDLLGPGRLGGHLSLHRHVPGAVSLEQCVQQRLRRLRALVSLMMAWRFERRNTGGAACISGIFVFGNRSFASDSVDPSFQVIPKTRGRREFSCISAA